MIYRTELRCHTQGVSVCAECPPEEGARLYIEAGYRTVVVTDHMNRWTFRDLPAEMPWESRVEHFLSGWRRSREAAGERLAVLLGMELRFDALEFSALLTGMSEGKYDMAIAA